MGHHENSGLQGHSVGEIYPWSIVIVDCNGNGACEGRNLITGETCCIAPYNCSDCNRSFGSAHRAAESFIRGRIEQDRCNARADREDRQWREHCAICDEETRRANCAVAEFEKLAQSEQPAELTVCRLIVPVKRSSDGKSHSTGNWDYLHSYLCNVFGGFTQHRVSGSWRDDNGKFVNDDSWEFQAAGSPAAVKSLTTQASNIAAIFDQVCVYVAVGSTAKLYYRA